MDKDLERWERVFLAALVLFVLAAGLAKISQHTNYGAVDTAAYLGHALEISDHGGVLNLLKRLYSGEYPVSVQQPLFLAIQSLAADETMDFFVRAKFVNLLLSLAGLLAAFFVLRKELGLFEGVAGAALTGLSAHYLQFAAIVAVEPFTICWAVLTWFCGVKALRFRGEGVKWGLLTGAFGALAYLSKGNGHVVFLAWLCAFVVVDPKRFWRRRSLYAAAAVFLIAASPVLTRNILAYGKLFHAPQHSMIWAENWRDYYRIEFMENPPTFQDYMAAHTIGDLIRRFAFPFCDQLYWFGYLLRPFSAPYGLIRPLAVLFNSLFAWGLIREKDPARRWFTLIFWGGLVAMGTLGGHFHNAPRMYIQILPLFIAYGARGGLDLIERCARRDFLEKRAVVASAAVLLLLSGVIAASGRIGDLRGSYRVNEDLWRLRNRLVDLRGGGEGVFWGPSHSSLCWTSSGLQMNYLPLPLTEDWTALNRYADEKRVRWMAVEGEEMYFRRGNLLGLYVNYEAGHFSLVENPPGWELHEKDQNGVVDWLLFRRTGG